MKTFRLDFPMDIFKRHAVSNVYNAVRLGTDHTVYTSTLKVGGIDCYILVFPDASMPQVIDVWHRLKNRGMKNYRHIKINVG